MPGHLVTRARRSSIPATVESLPLCEDVLKVDILNGFFCKILRKK